MGLTIPLRTQVFGLVALIVLVAAPFLGALSQTHQILLALAGIGLVGLPHGAADIWLAGQRGLITSLTSTVVFMLGYVALAAVVVGVWFAAPTISLAVFLTISAWHFGGDWERSGRHILRLTAGVTLLCAPSLFRPEEMTELYSTLSGEHSAPLVALQQIVFWPAVWAFTLFSLAWNERGDRLSGCIELGALVLLSAVLPVVIWFAVYFCALHSPRHLGALWTNAPQKRRHSLVIWSITLTLVSLLAGAVLYASLKMSGAELSQALIQTGFIGLAALTVPHMALVDGPKSQRLSTVGGTA